MENKIWITKICPDCKRDLPMSEFYKKLGRSDSYCKDCKDIRTNKWREKNKERVRTNQRNYSRKHRIHETKTNNKRDYPEDELCELCSKKVRLCYHHWDDNDHRKGMWICLPCHCATTWLEKHDQILYFNKKQDIEQGVAKKLRYWEEE